MDGLRAMQLKPDDAQGHICYIKALRAAGDVERTKIAIEEYSKQFFSRDGGGDINYSFAQCMFFKKVMGSHDDLSVV